MNKPLVSAIIIFLNEEKFLREAIESVFAQTYDNWELLIVDDGSTDASTKNALQYAEQYPTKVRYLEHEAHQNRGMSASRNLGIRHAKGEYIGFLDADDVWLPHKLQRQVVLLESYPSADMIYGASQYWYSWTGNPEDAKRDFVPSVGVGPNILVRSPTLLTLSLEEKAPTPCPSAVLVRREMVESVGGFEEVFGGLYEDRAFLAKVQLKGCVFVSGEYWNRYRQHPDSSSSAAKKTEQRQLARLFYLNWLEEYLTDRRVRDAELWKVLRKKRRQSSHSSLYRLLERTQHRVKQVRALLKSRVRRPLLV